MNYIIFFSAGPTTLSTVIPSTLSTLGPSTLSTVSSTINPPTNNTSTISNIDNTCCENLELSFQGQRSGSYEIQTEKFNDRNVWKLVDGQYVVWFNNITDQWIIGSSVGSGGGFFSPSGFECPNEVGSQWTYHGVGSDNTVLDAGNDVSVKCQGKE